MLGLLEGEPERFASALRAFERMVDIQIERREGRIGPARHRRPRVRGARKAALPPELAGASARPVVVYAEANAGTLEGAPVVPGLVQLVAVRPATGERFTAVVRPAAPLGENVARHVELEAARIAAGEPAAAVLGRFAAFLGEGDVLCSWGRFALVLLDGQLGPERPRLDLRVWTSRRLGRRSGGIEQASAALGAQPSPPWAEGRAGRRVVALEAILARLLDEPR